MTTFSVIVNYDHNGRPSELVYDIPVKEFELVMNLLSLLETKRGG